MNINKPNNEDCNGPIKIILEDNEYCRIKTTTGDMVMNDVVEIDVYNFSKENKE
jgi:hypothetical protein